MNEQRSSSGTGIGDKGSKILLKLARPDIYRINAFRVLEIPVTASPRVVSSQMRKLDLMEKLGDAEQVQRGLLPLTPLPDSGARREAYQRLTDPESRLIDELFWFWPLRIGLPEDKDDALVAMKRNDFSGAVSIWKQHEEKASEANVSMHNLAIMYHALALDIEYAGVTQALSKKQVQQKQFYWEQAFLRWQILLNHEGFWQRLTKRIRELDDPRLTTGTAHRIQAGLPLAILSVNAMLAVQAAQKGNNDEALYHVNLMGKSGFDKATVDEALHRAVASICDRIKIICTNAENETKRAPEHADEVIHNVINQTSQLLATLDMLLPEGDATWESAHDKVASQILSSDIAFCNETRNWRTSLELLEQALPIAASASVRQRVEKNIEIDKGNLEYSTCWFCKKRPAEDKAVAEVKMHGDVTRTPTFEGTHIEWRKITVKVPRCKQCKSVHSRETSIKVSLPIVGFILAWVVGAAVNNGWAGFGVFVACFAAGFIIPLVTRPSGMKPDSYKREFSSVKELKSQGWEFGEKPPGVS
jgi:hypothetical protein